jgi:hypothetical protein
MFLGAYWARRKESGEGAAQRIVEFLSLAGERSPAFSTWYKTKGAKSLSNESVPLSDLAKHLEVNRRDRTREEMPDLGFCIWLWNDDESSFNATLGVDNANVGNAVVLKNDLDTIEAPTWRTLLEAAVRIFDPDRAVVRSPRSIGSRTGQPSSTLFTFERGHGIRTSADHTDG